MVQGWTERQFYYWTGKRWSGSSLEARTYRHERTAYRAMERIPAKAVSEWDKEEAIIKKQVVKAPENN